MTKQEIYDKVKAHLLAQGKRSTDGGKYGMCRYRSLGGLKCAVGVLIADEHYSPGIEGGSSEHEIVRSALRKSGVTGANRLLSELQYIHDYWDPEEWRKHLEELAKKEGLNP